MSQVGRHFGERERERCSPLDIYEEIHALWKEISEEKLPKVKSYCFGRNLT